MKRIIPFVVIGASIVSITFYSCKKEEPDTEAQSALDNSICEGEFTSIGTVTSDFGIKENGIKSHFRSCPVISSDSNLRILTIDYQTGCIASDGKNRSGKIIAKFTGKWGTPGTKMSITLDNYKVNNITFACDSITIQRSANVTNSFTTVVYKGTCASTNWNMEWEGSRTMTQTAGADGVMNTVDDIFELTGNASGKNRNGKAYTSYITVPIQKSPACNYIKAGRIDLTPDGLATRTIDYGNGNCDNDATLTINGNTYTFKLD